MFVLYEKLVRGSELPYVELTSTQEEICNLIVSVARFFFKGGKALVDVPFRGFLLEGPPGNGKTEIVKQAVRRLSLEIGEVYLSFLDSAKIAGPRWGEAEKALRNEFRLAHERKNEHIVMLFDDIDCLMIKRGSELAKEWHYSLNSLIFHEIDHLHPSRVMVIATTNRPGLIDDALRSRLYCVDVPPLPIEELEKIAHSLVKNSTIGVDGALLDEIIRSVITKLRSKENPTIRDVQHYVVTECISKGAWIA